jgi:putative SOS response-associated peptidase YedK
MPLPKPSRKERRIAHLSDLSDVLCPQTASSNGKPTVPKKQPYKIAVRNGALIAFAGLWERWTPESGDPVETFTIITTAASKLISEVHDRMPVIVAPADYQLWLTASPATAKKLLLPYASGLTITPIGERVNNVQNDDVELLLPLSAP